jgi:hypothetical protein
MGAGPGSPVARGYGAWCPTGIATGRASARRSSRSCSRRRSRRPPARRRPTSRRIFAPGIVSVAEYSEFVCIFSPDGTECVFDRHGDERYQKGAVFVTRIVDGAWTPPEIHPLFTRFGDVFLPTMSPDGRFWFFTSKTLPVPDGVRKIIPLYYVQREAAGWSEPVYLTQAIHASATREGTVYVNSGRPIVPSPDLAAVRDLRHEVDFDAGHAVVSSDGRYLVFDNRELPATGDCRLFVSFRSAAGTWGAPVSLGGRIRQHAFCAWISPDGEYLFFHSRDGRRGNIYWVSTDIIEDLAPGRSAGGGGVTRDGSAPRSPAGA